MENHSFDNLLGALAHSGQPKARGLRIQCERRRHEQQPGPEGSVRSFPFATTAQGQHVSQSWNATHEQIDEGKMDGFVRSVEDAQPMGYWTQDVLPFAYSLARTFCVANRWFGSAPCQTYPNRRFLMAGTAYGNIATDTESLLDPPPPNGTIWDRLHHYGISWRNYFTDLPSVGVIGSTVEKYPQNLVPDRAVLRRLRRRQPALGEHRRPRVRRAPARSAGRSPNCPALAAVGRKVSRRAARRRTRRTWPTASTGPRSVVKRDARLARLAAHAADLHLRRARRLLRPRAAAARRSRPTRSRRRSGPTTCPAATTSTARACPPSWPRPTPSPTPSTNVVHDHTSFLATVEAKWNLPRLPIATPTPRRSWTSSTSNRPAFMNPPTIAGRARPGRRGDDALGEAGPCPAHSRLLLLWPPGGGDAVARAARHWARARRWRWLACAAGRARLERPRRPRGRRRSSTCG